MPTFYNAIGETIEKPADTPVTWRLSAYGLVISDEHKVLVVRPVWGKVWELPGGGIEVEESISECILREGWEETGHRFEIIDQHPFHIGERHFYDMIAQTFHHAVMHIHRVRLLPADRKTSHIDPKEIAEMQWVLLADLNQTNCHPIIWPAIKKAQELCASNQT